eukprot:CAMPEP_0167757870 /NCGR_PEP_ID=MMETSP0110_2-20121227/10162_1 /TAXON_ID=629695 /ORGANISM="Gymnochlora sp., Strain CCMP2014" /LENGTH=261 /DNA_ID=CAMNT_0007644101 /DNA_START=115 /DNA_END=900 /DNA_ORIENTATION=-
MTAEGGRSHEGNTKTTAEGSRSKKTLTRLTSKSLEVKDSKSRSKSLSIPEFLLYAPTDKKDTAATKRRASNFTPPATPRLVTSRKKGFSALLGTSALISDSGTKYSMEKLAYYAKEGLGLYFTSANSGPCKRFTEVLREAYSNLLKDGRRIEIVTICMDKEKKDYWMCTKQMPWPSMHFSLNLIRKRLVKRFKVHRSPTLIFVDKDGKLLTSKGRKAIYLYKDKAFPFTDSRIQELTELKQWDDTMHDLRPRNASRSMKEL